MRTQHQTQNMMHSSRPSRKGAILTVVMICLLICSIVLGSILTLQIRLHHQLEREEAAQQADLFAQAGLERALIRLKQDPEYRGEGWKPSTGKRAGFVKIDVVQSRNIPNEFDIQIAARFPSEVENSPQRIRELTIQRSF